MTARRLALLAVGVVLLAGCGGPRTSTGRVSDLRGRLCLQTDRDASTCFAAPDAQLAQLTLGTCVEVTYTQGAGTVAEATGVRRVDPPCFSAG